MPYSDPERRRSYARAYRRTRRAGDTRSTPVHPSIPVEVRLQTTHDVLDLIETQVGAVLGDPSIDTVARARCIGYLASISLRTIEAGNLAARVEMLEAVLKQRGEVP